MVKLSGPCGQYGWTRQDIDGGLRVHIRCLSSIKSSDSRVLLKEHTEAILTLFHEDQKWCHATPSCWRFCCGVEWKTGSQAKFDASWTSGMFFRVQYKTLLRTPTTFIQQTLMVKILFEKQQTKTNRSMQRKRVETEKTQKHIEPETPEVRTDKKSENLIKLEFAQRVKPRRPGKPTHTDMCRNRLEAHFAEYFVRASKCMSHQVRELGKSESAHEADVGTTCRRVGEFGPTPTDTVVQLRLASNELTQLTVAAKRNGESLSN